MASEPDQAPRAQSLLTLGALALLLSAAALGFGRVFTGAEASLRLVAAADVSLVAVTAPPVPHELTALIRAGQAFGPKIAVLVYPTEPSTLPADRAATLEGRASVARLSLSRAGWEVLVLGPNGRLREVWQQSLHRRPALNRS